MSVLFAAFEPFGGRDENRAERAVRRLCDLPGVEIASLPVSFARAPVAIAALLARRPEVLVIVGESRRARGLELERFALNFADARIPDNDGAQPRGRHLVEDGPLAREVRFDLAAALAAAHATGVRAAVSAHAGTFLCNAALYHALGHTAESNRVRAVALVHVPARRRRLRAGAAADALLSLGEALRKA